MADAQMPFAGQGASAAAGREPASRDREPMRYLIRISAAALAACMASLVALSSAQAAVTPLPKIQAYNVVGWSGMVKRPSYFA